MRIGVFANTPGQLHFYRNIVKGLEDHGHDVSVLVRKYGEMHDLLDQLDVTYYTYSSNPPSKLGKMLAFPGDLSRAHARSISARSGEQTPPRGKLQGDGVLASELLHAKSRCL